MKISKLTIFLIAITIVTLIGYSCNLYVTNVSHSISNSLYEISINHNGTLESYQLLANTYDSIKNIELNQKNNASISRISCLLVLIFTLFSYKLDNLKQRFK